MSLRSTLVIGLLTIALIFVIPLLFAAQSLSRLGNDARALQSHEFAGSLLLGRLREGLYTLRNRETALLFLHTAGSRDAMASTIAETMRLGDSLKAYQLTAAADDAQREIGVVARWAPDEYQAALADRKAEADSISEHFIRPALSGADSAVQTAERDLRVRTAQRVADATVTIARDRRMAVTALVLALFVAAGIAAWLTRWVSEPVLALESGMRAVADGDLGHRLDMNVARRDEFGRLAQNFQEMTRQLVELDKLKAEFVSIASHELKTPINVIMGYLQLFDEGLYGPLTEAQADVHRTLEAQAQALLRLVNQLLDVSRFEAGGGRLDLHRVSLPRLLDDLERTFHVLAAQRGVYFVVDRHEGLPSDVTWDGDRVNEVLGNLLSNAFKFTGRGGRVELAVEPADGGVRMEVHDTGPGIPPDQVPRIFEKFFQADNQRAASARGSGLGLAIAKEIVDAHGGTISCESILGVGTTFALVLPARVTRRVSNQRTQPVETRETAGAGAHAG